MQINCVQSDSWSYLISKLLIRITCLEWCFVKKCCWLSWSRELVKPNKKLVSNGIVPCSTIFSDFSDKGGVFTAENTYTRVWFIISETKRESRRLARDQEINRNPHLSITMKFHSNLRRPLRPPLVASSYCEGVKNKHNVRFNRQLKRSDPARPSLYKIPWRFVWSEEKKTGILVFLETQGFWRQVSILIYNIKAINEQTIT